MGLILARLQRSDSLSIRQQSFENFTTTQLCSFNTNHKYCSVFHFCYQFCQQPIDFQVYLGWLISTMWNTSANGEADTTQLDTLPVICSRIWTEVWQAGDAKLANWGGSPLSKIQHYALWLCLYFKLKMHGLFCIDYLEIPTKLKYIHIYMCVCVHVCNHD